MNILKVKEATKKTVWTPADVMKEMKEVGKADREHFFVIHLNTKNMIIEKECVAIGTLDMCPLHPREVFRKAVINSTSSIVTVHNHPSGDATPSQNDFTMWRKLKQAGEILGIPVVDNLIVTSQKWNYYSTSNAGVDL